MSLRQPIRVLQGHLDQNIIGQPVLTHRILTALLANGHLIVEGPPGLAKTRAIKCLADGIEADFHRVQFTPDLLPADITGGDIYRPENGSFHFEPGPIFHNLILADEINRAPAKVQSALLEAMAERQISVGRHTYHLPDLFLVMATQNPLEQEGTYPLPEAQLDRFLLHVNVDYPDADAERRILQMARSEEGHEAVTEIPRISQTQLLAARHEILDMHMSEAVEKYLVQLVVATRQPEQVDPELKNWLDCGASPRATIALDRCARAHAWLDDRDFVTPDDLRNMIHDVLRHRLLLSFEAEASGITTDDVVGRILQAVPSA